MDAPLQAHRPARAVDGPVQRLRRVGRNTWSDAAGGRDRLDPLRRLRGAGGLAGRARPARRVRVRARRPGCRCCAGSALVGSALAIMVALQRMPLADDRRRQLHLAGADHHPVVPVLGEVVGLAALGGGGGGAARRAGGGAARDRGVPAGGPFSPSVALCWAVAARADPQDGRRPSARHDLLWSAVGRAGRAHPAAAGRRGVAEPLALGLALVPGDGSLHRPLPAGLAYRHAPASLLAPFSYLQLIWSTVLGWLVFAAWPDGLDLRRRGHHRRAAGFTWPAASARAVPRLRRGGHEDAAARRRGAAAGTETPLRGIGLFVLATFCFSGSTRW